MNKLAEQKFQVGEFIRFIDSPESLSFIKTCLRSSRKDVVDECWETTRKAIYQVVGYEYTVFENHTCKATYRCKDEQGVTRYIPIALAEFVF